MEFDIQPRTSRRGEGIVPMINVVFLLMIFFLMSTTLSPEVTSVVEPPSSSGGEATSGDRQLVVRADGGMAFGALRGDAALEAAAEATAPGETLLIQADRDVDGAAIARLMTRLGEAGVQDSALVTAAGR